MYRYGGKEIWKKKKKKILNFNSKNRIFKTVSFN